MKQPGLFLWRLRAALCRPTPPPDRPLFYPTVGDREGSRHGPVTPQTVIPALSRDPFLGRREPRASCLAVTTVQAKTELSFPVGPWIPDRGLR